MNVSEKTNKNEKKYKFFPDQLHQNVILHRIIYPSIHFFPLHYRHQYRNSLRSYIDQNHQSELIYINKKKIIVKRDMNDMNNEQEMMNIFQLIGKKGRYNRRSKIIYGKCKKYIYCGLGKESIMYDIKKKKEYVYDDKDVNCIAFTKDMKYIICVGQYKEVDVYSIEELDKWKKPKIIQQLYVQSYGNDVRCFNDDKGFIVCTDSRGYHIFKRVDHGNKMLDKMSRKEENKEFGLFQHVKNVMSDSEYHIDVCCNFCSVSCDSKYSIIACDSEIRVFSIEKMKELEIIYLNDVRKKRSRNGRQKEIDKRCNIVKFSPLDEKMFVVGVHTNCYKTEIESYLYAGLIVKKGKYEEVKLFKICVFKEKEIEGICFSPDGYKVYCSCSFYEENNDDDCDSDLDEELHYVIYENFISPVFALRTISKFRKKLLDESSLKDVKVITIT